LDVFKTQGRTLISDKFAQIYNRKLNRLEDCESLKDLLHKSKKAFWLMKAADIKANIEQALYSLEFQRKELQRQLENGKIRLKISKLCYL